MDVEKVRKRSRRRTSINIPAMLGASRRIVSKHIKPTLSRIIEPDIISEDHKEIFSIVSYNFDINEDDVENYALNSPNGIDILKEYSDSEEGFLMFFCQKEKMFEIKNNEGENVMVPLILTDGKTYSLNGDCMYFFKTNRVKNKIFGRFCVNCNSENSMKLIIADPLRNLFLPWFEKGEDWSRDKLNGMKNKRTCIDSFHHFLSYIDATEDNFKHIVKFSDSKKIDISLIKTVLDCEKFVLFDDKVKLVEDMMKNWIKKIEEVVAESKQIRQETDETGPMHELQYWRYMLCRFNSVVEFVESDKFRIVIRILSSAQSRILRMWTEQQKILIDKINEARDNVKFLNKLEKICEKFYKNDMDEIKSAIPLLISKVQVIHSISRFYHTAEHITSFFRKITNQIVIVCKNYITDSGKNGLWTMSREKSVSRMKNCIELFQSYKTLLKNAKQQNADALRAFEFFEVPVLGTFHSFCKRLSSICIMFKMIDELLVLQQCYIEGIEVYSSKLNSVVNVIKSKTYDLLDHRKTDFNTDYKEFLRQIDELKMNLQNFVNNQFEDIASTYQSLLLLERFQNLSISNLDTTSQYVKIFKYFEFEMDTIKKIYNRKKQDPKGSVALYYSRKIAWARALYKRIEDPMKLLKPNLHLLPAQDSERIVKTYNILGEILVEYMVIHHKAYCLKIKDAINEVQKNIVIQKQIDYDATIWEVNFTDTLYRMIRDSQNMVGLGLTIPEEGKFLLRHYEKLMSSRVKMRDLILTFRKAEAKISSIFLPLILPHVKKVNAAIKPGGTYLNWLTSKMDAYITNIRKALVNLEYVIKKVSDINSVRLDSVLNLIQNISLFKVPEKSLDPEDFPAYVERHNHPCYSPD